MADQKTKTSTDQYSYEIDPAIGVARLGNSPNEFCLSPLTIGGLPVEYDGQCAAPTPDKAIPVTDFKDSVGRIKRQAATFTVWRKDNTTGTRVPVLTSTSKNGSVQAKTISWTVHVANKKPIWYTFSELQGDWEFGSDNSYQNQHIPMNNAQAQPTSDNPNARQEYIIDPGPRGISTPGGSEKISRYNVDTTAYPRASFPPADIGGQQINELGELKMDDDGRLLFLGGFGHVTGSGEITSFRGASEYWDDICDGYVIAEIKLEDGTTVKATPGYVIVGSPKFAPEIVNITTLADTLYDGAIRNSAYDPSIFKAGDNTASQFTLVPGNYNPLNGYQPSYTVCYETDIKPILDRMDRYRWVADVALMSEFARPQFDMTDSSSANADKRKAYFQYFRVPLLPADYATDGHTANHGPNTMYAPDGMPMMPLNSGDNSVTNSGPIYKFMTLSPTQYFFLHQWAAGKFTSGGSNQPDRPFLDHADIGNCVGAPFSPGIEVTWSVRSPELYESLYQIQLAHLTGTDFSALVSYYKNNGLSTTRDECDPNNTDKGVEPGDLTKRMAIPWMADFQECTVQTPNTSNSYINQMADGSGIEVPPAYYVYWWPPQSPFNVYVGNQNPSDQVLDAMSSFIDEQTVIPAGQNVEYQRSILNPQDMINNWFMLGFIKNQTNDSFPYLVEVERNFDQLAQYELQRQLANANSSAKSASQAK